MRFPGFDEDWKTKKLGDVIEFKAGYAFPSNKMLNEKSTYQLIKMSNVYRNELRLDRNPSFWNQVDTKQTEFLLKKGDTVLTLTGTVGKKDFGYSVQINEDDKYLLNQRLVLLREKERKSVNGFISHMVSNEKFLSDFFETAKGGTGNQTNVGIESIKNLTFYFPVNSEQRKIADFLAMIDLRIQTQNKIIEELSVSKKTFAKRIFSQEFRFKDDSGNEFADWEEKKLGSVLNYEQPTNYLVSDTEYDQSFSTPVVTAGKTFILGYTNEQYGIFQKEKLPVIIFDDFTTASQFVDFPFKAKSSAMKILKSKSGNNIKFIYEALQMINYEVGGHGRHWISVFSDLGIPVPSKKEQTKIANFLSSIDSKIDMENQLLQKLEEQKKYLLQNMFV